MENEPSAALYLRPVFHSGRISAAGRLSPSLVQPRAGNRTNGVAALTEQASRRDTELVGDVGRPDGRIGTTVLLSVPGGNLLFYVGDLASTRPDSDQTYVACDILTATVSPTPSATDLPI